MGAGLVKGESDSEADAPTFEDPNFVRQSCDKGGVSFGMKNCEGMIAKGKDSRGGGRVRNPSPQNDPLMSKVQAVKKT